MPRELGPRRLVQCAQDGLGRQPSAVAVERRKEPPHPGLVTHRHREQVARRDPVPTHPLQHARRHVGGRPRAKAAAVEEDQRVLVPFAVEVARRQQRVAVVQRRPLADLAHKGRRRLLRSEGRKPVSSGPDSRRSGGRDSDGCQPVEAAGPARGSGPGLLKAYGVDSDTADRLRLSVRALGRGGASTGLAGIPRYSSHTRVGIAVFGDGAGSRVAHRRESILFESEQSPRASRQWCLWVIRNGWERQEQRRSRRRASFKRITCTAD